MFILSNSVEQWFQPTFGTLLACEDDGTHETHGETSIIMAEGSCDENSYTQADTCTETHTGERERNVANVSVKQVRAHFDSFRMNNCQVGKVDAES